MPEKHGHAIECVVFGCNNVWCAAAIPIERRIKNSLHEISVWHVVGPLALALKPSADGVMALRFLAEALLGQLRISDHEVTGDEGGLDRDFPFLVELLATAFLAGGVPIFAFGAICFHPFEGFFQLGLIVDPALDATNEFRHVHGLDAHAEPFFKQSRINNRAGDAHGCAAHREIGAAAEGRCGQAGAHESEELFFDIRRDRLVAAVLDVAAIDSKGRQALLGVSREHGGEVDSAGTLSAIESPDGLGCERIGIHRFRAVAPAGSHGEGNAHILAAKLLRAGGSFRNAADTGVRNHTFHGLAG